MRALIVSKVDYCNSVLAGISRQLQDRLHSVLNATTPLVLSARRSERITPLRRELHWLRVLERNKNKHEEPEDKNPYFLYAHLIVDLMRPLVNHC